MFVQHIRRKSATSLVYYDSTNLAKATKADHILHDTMCPTKKGQHQINSRVPQRKSLRYKLPKKKANLLGLQYNLLSMVEIRLC